jgi:uncharacterized Zn-finger protein
MHKGDTPYKCDQCEKSFTQRGNLVKHQRQHKYKNLRARKIHKCKICTKCFTEKYNLKVSIIAKTLPPLSSLLSPLSSPPCHLSIYVHDHHYLLIHNDGCDGGNGILRKEDFIILSRDL